VFIPTEFGLQPGRTSESQNVEQFGRRGEPAQLACFLADADRELITAVLFDTGRFAELVSQDRLSDACGKQAWRMAIRGESHCHGLHP
jgi:hypothetical protein